MVGLFVGLWSTLVVTAWCLLIDLSTGVMQGRVTGPDSVLQAEPTTGLDLPDH